MPTNHCQEAHRCCCDDRRDAGHCCCRHRCDEIDVRGPNAHRRGNDAEGRQRRDDVELPVGPRPDGRPCAHHEEGGWGADARRGGGRGAPAGTACISACWLAVGRAGLGPCRDAPRGRQQRCSVRGGWGVRGRGAVTVLLVLLRGAEHAVSGGQRVACGATLARQRQVPHARARGRRGGRVGARPQRAEGGLRVWQPAGAGAWPGAGAAAGVMDVDPDAVRG